MCYAFVFEPLVCFNHFKECMACMYEKSIIKIHHVVDVRMGYIKINNDNNNDDKDYKYQISIKI